MPDRDAFLRDLVTDPLQWLFQELHETWEHDPADEYDDRVPMYRRSPLEAKFRAWWGAKFIYESWLSTSLPHVLWLRDQVEVQAGGHAYHLDFVPVYDEPRTKGHALDTRGVHCEHRSALDPLRHPFIAVELDGHDFHERTKAQVRRRDKRDRDLQAAGWRLMHFSGSEFHRDPAKCVDEVWWESWRARPGGQRMPDRITVDFQEMFPCPAE